MERRKFWRWLAWYFKKSISSARFLSSASFFYLICFSKASFFFFNYYTFSSLCTFFYSSYRIAVFSSGAPCSACNCLRIEKVSELS